MGGVFKYFWPQLVCAVLALGLWHTPVVKPFRVFMVFTHEICHAGATLFTGGEVAEIRTRWDESGHTISRGGNFPFIVSAGYVGSAFLGALLIYIGAWAALQRIVLASIGGVSLFMTARYTPVFGFDFAFGIAGGLILVAIPLWFPRAARWATNWLGILLCLYSLHDFRTDLWMYADKTDAGILARYWGAPFLAYPIAFTWAAISIFVMYLSLRAAANRARMRVNKQLGIPNIEPPADETPQPQGEF
ncbi:MAG: M50 family metallopeptidase [bacterium]|nr:M50 family metallopeptidase [bacterium]